MTVDGPEDKGFLQDPHSSSWPLSSPKPGPPGSRQWEPTEGCVGRGGTSKIRSKEGGQGGRVKQRWWGAGPKRGQGQWVLGSSSRQGPGGESRAVWGPDRGSAAASEPGSVQAAAGKAPGSHR